MWSTRGEEARLVCNQTLNVYHAGRRPPERRQGRAACPTASSPSACCSRPGCLCPERQKTSWFPVNSGLSFFSSFSSRKRRYFEGRDSNSARPHCDYDAGRQLRAEVIIQQPLERCILLHDQDKFSRGGNICALIKERTASAQHEQWHTGWCIEIWRAERKDEGYFWSRQCLTRQQLPEMTTMRC